MKSNVKFIYSLIEEDSIKEYAAFLKLKHIYVNGCVYNYSPFAFCKITGLSRNTIKKYVDFFLKEGWCRMHGKNLIFHKLEKIKEDKGINTVDAVILKINAKKDTLKSIQTKIYHAALKAKQDAYLFLLGKTRDKLIPSGKNCKLKYKKATRFFNNHPTIQPVKLPVCENGKLPAKKFKELSKFKISIKKIAEHLKISTTSAYRYLQSMKKSKILKIFKTHFLGRVLLHVNYKMFDTMMANHIGKNQFIANGALYTVECNKYSFL